MAWAVFADNGNIRIWGREKPAGFPDAVPMYLSPTVKDLLTVQIDPIGYADPDTLSDYRAGDRLHIPVYRPDASAEWQAGIPVYLHAAPQPAQVPDIVVTALDSARKSLATYGEHPIIDSHISKALAAITAAPSGDAKREAEIKVEAVVEAFAKLAAEYRPHGLNCTYTAFDVANHIEAQGHYYAARLRQSDSGDDSEGVE